jgi:hypothetical protein
MKNLFSSTNDLISNATQLIGINAKKATTADESFEFEGTAASKKYVAKETGYLTSSKVTIEIE